MKAYAQYNVNLSCLMRKNEQLANKKKTNFNFTECSHRNIFNSVFVYFKITILLKKLLRYNPHLLRLKAF